jgi:hypothetical protein
MKVRWNIVSLHRFNTLKLQINETLVIQNYISV